MRKINSDFKIAIFLSGKTQRQIAQESGISETILSMIVHGKYNPDDQQKNNIAGAMGMDTKKIFGK